MNSKFFPPHPLLRFCFWTGKLDEASMIVKFEKDFSFFRFYFERYFVLEVSDAASVDEEEEETSKLN